MRTYLWLGVHDEGLQSYGTLKGENFKDALRNELEEHGAVIYWNKIDFDAELSEGQIIDKIDEYIENSEVDGDSTEQVIVFDITDPSDVKIEHPNLKIIGFYNIK